MTCGTGIQAKGSAASFRVATESEGYTCPITDPRVVNMPFNSTTLTLNRALNVSNTLRGNRNPTQPFQGNKDVSGDVVIPVDLKTVGWWFKKLTGAPTTLESVAASKSKATLPATLTIAGGAGAGTFSTGQTLAAVGDRVIYRASAGTARISAFMNTETTPDTVWTLETTRAGGTPAPNITAAVVIGIARNFAAASPGTIGVSAGVLTFSATQVGAVAGRQVLAAGGRRFKLVENTGTNIWTVVDEYGDPAPADLAGGTALDAIEDATLWTHTFKVGATAGLESFVAEKGFTDMGVPMFFRYTGVKAGQFQLTAGGDQELVATISLIGADEEISYQPLSRVDHMTLISSAKPLADISSNAINFTAGGQTAVQVGDLVVYRETTGTLRAGVVVSEDVSNDVFTLEARSGSSTPDATGVTVEAIYPLGDDADLSANLFGDRFHQFDASVAVDSVTRGDVAEMQFSFNNQLDGEQYAIGAGGLRDDIPEGIAETGGSMTTLLKGADLVEAGAEVAELDMTLAFARGDSSLSLRLPESNISAANIPISGPEGIRASYDFQGYLNDDANGSALVVTLVNEQQLYS